MVAIDDLRDADYPRYRDYLQKHKNDKVLLTVRRDGALIDSLALPVDAEGRIGVTVTNPYSLRTQYYTFWESIPQVSQGRKDDFELLGPTEADRAAQNQNVRGTGRIRGYRQHLPQQLGLA